MSEYVPAKTGLTRVFLIEGRASPANTAAYQSCMRLAGISRGFGDVESIECPDPNSPGQYVEVGKIRGQKERGTTTVEGRYALKLRSDLLRLANTGCPIDVQLHMGDCEDLSNFNQFDKIVIFEDVNITNYGTDDLGSLQSADESAINEQADISAKEIYEIVPLGFGQKGADEIVNEVVDITFCDSIQCGDCGDSSDGCQTILAVTVASGGSPATNPDLAYSLDGGLTWVAHDIDSLSGGEDATGVACVGSYVVVTAASNAHHYIAKTDVDGVTDPTFTQVTTGYADNPQDIFSLGSYAFVVGASGYVYGISDASTGVTVLDTGAASSSDQLNKVHALSSSVAVAVGNNGAVVYTTNQSTWSAATRPTGAGVHLNAVVMINDTTWIVGSAAGTAFYTKNSGTTWTSLAFSGSGSGVVRDIAKATDSVLYMTHDTTTPAGRILQSVDGGNTWTVMPRSVGTIPANDRLTAVAACNFDPNVVVAGGLADDGSDGIIILGTA